MAKTCCKNVYIKTSYTNYLQEDLHHLELWEKEWSMEFNPDKCKVLRIHRKKKPVISYKHYHKQCQKQSEMHKTKSQHTKQTTKIGCIQNICKPPGRILFNHMAPLAETPHTQNRNGSKVSRKVCSK